MVLRSRNSSENYSDEMRNGDAFNQAEFHAIYERMPPDYKAELIDGLVYVREPQGWLHADATKRLLRLFCLYEDATPGVQTLADASVILGQEDEVQPDLFLRILPEFNGQSVNAGKYVSGAPELVAEVSYTTRSIDLHKKRKRYVDTGVIEYIVFCLDPIECHWFDLPTGTKLEPDTESIFRSRVFPGLWIHGQALIDFDYQKLASVMFEGLASDEHRRFSEQLKMSRKNKT